MIGSFCLSICLRVIRGGEFDIVVEESCQFSGKGGCELWASIGYQRVVEGEAFEHMVKKMLGHSGCIYGF